MSKGKGNQYNTEWKQEKVVTRYDRKMQRREEEKKQAEKEELISKITGVAIVIALLCLVASFPIRNYLTVYGTYIKVGGEKVTKVEFDYNYNIVKNNYISQNGYYLSMFGVDLSGDVSKITYSGSMSYQDYFEQTAVQNIMENRALKSQAKAAGFTYDVSEDYAEYAEAMKTAAREAGMSEKAYIQQLYGSLATTSRVKPFIEDTLMTSEYYSRISKEKAPSDAKIDSYYAENPDDYDSVDYRVLTVNAELPTEPTDLADPVEETEGSETDADAAYQPSEAEIAFAMEKAKAEAEASVNRAATEGSLYENVLKSGAVSYYRDWLFAEDRKPGDTTVVENEYSHLYYVVAFEQRYRDETPTVDLRLILLEDGDGQAVLNEWKNGGATEESFGKLADKYNDVSMVASDGGLLEGITVSGLPEEMEQWVSESGRAKGDTVAIAPEDGYTYVLYYIGTNSPSWRINIKSTLTSEAMADYMKEITQSYDVEDPKGRLNYLKVQAEDASGEASD